MPVHTDDALVLRTYKLAEADRIVVFLTRTRGKKRGVARGARRTRSKFAGALEPLTRVHVAYFEKESRELVTLNYAEPIASPFSAPGAGALEHVGYFAELLDQVAPDANPDERLFRLGAAAVDALMSAVPAAALARYVEYWVLRLQGVYPPLARCPQCAAPFGTEGAWLLRHDAVLLCVSCARAAGPADLSAAALAYLSAVASLPPTRVNEVRLEPPVGREIEAVHRTLIASHLDREPRSGRVLREMGLSFSHS